MKRVLFTALVLVCGLPACSAPKREQQNVSGEAAPVSPQPIPAVTDQALAEQGGKLVGKAKASLVEPKGSIHPKGTEAAGQIVQLFAAHLEAGQFKEAAEQWSDPAAGLGFVSQFKQAIHVEISELTPAEGAAGSIYTTMPVIFHGDGFRRRAEITLRRVNDVPGSTARQRQWHIEQIQWKTAD